MRGEWRYVRSALAAVTVAVEITSRRGNAVLLSAEEFSALEETAYLLRVPANARRLVESLQQARTGDRHEHDLAE